MSYLNFVKSLIKLEPLKISRWAPYATVRMHLHTCIGDMLPLSLPSSPSIRPVYQDFVNDIKPVPFVQLKESGHNYIVHDTTALKFNNYNLNLWLV